MRHNERHNSPERSGQFAKKVEKVLSPWEATRRSVTISEQVAALRKYAARFPDEAEYLGYLVRLAELALIHENALIRISDLAHERGNSASFVDMAIASIADTALNWERMPVTEDFEEERPF